jgi:peptide chain release factor 2
VRDLTADLAELRRRLSESEKDLGLSVKRARLAELEKKASEPSLWDDPNEARKVTSELALMKDDIDLLEGLDRRLSDVEVLFELGREESDDSVEAEVEAGLASLIKEFDALELRSLYSGEHDERDAVCEVHSGAGGTDAQDWAEMLLRMYLRWAERRGYSTEILDLTEGEEAGIKSATVEITGKYGFGYLQSERGVHRLVRLSPFNSASARQTSFAKVEVMPEVEQVGEIEISPDDVRIDVYRSSGAGGQNVQKNSTAVRLTHIPTGIVVTCQNERSQGRNRESAMKVLEARLLEIELNRQEEEKARLKGQHMDVSFGSQIRNYVLHPYKMVKDVRTDFETSDTTAVLDGEIDGFIEAYLKSRVGEDQ